MINEFKDRIDKNPNDAEAHWKYGCCLGFMGKWEEAWPEIEWRFKGHLPSMNKRKMYPKPDWDGSSGRVLVYQDQGFGDFIQNCRYLPLFKDCEVILECHPYLFNLMKLNFPYIHCVLKDTQLPEYDYVVPICSMPYHFKCMPEIHLESPKRGKFNTKGIGVAWIGSSVRSCKKEDMECLGEDLISLAVQEKGFVDFSRRLVDFSDTAELINELDCVVSVDTAVGHLAASLGKTTYLALSHVHDWRWGVGDDTVWYPSMKLFRQSSSDDWQSVFLKIKETLWTLRSIGL